jgi:hypothetical protein
VSCNILSRYDLFKLDIKEFCDYLTSQFDWLILILTSHPTDPKLFKLHLGIKGNGDGITSGCILKTETWRDESWLKSWVHMGVFGSW